MVCEWRTYCRAWEMQKGKKLKRNGEKSWELANILNYHINRLHYNARSISQSTLIIITMNESNYSVIFIATADVIGYRARKKGVWWCGVAEFISWKCRNFCNFTSPRLRRMCFKAKPPAHTCSNKKFFFSPSLLRSLSIEQVQHVK